MSVYTTLEISRAKAVDLAVRKTLRTVEKVVRAQVSMMDDKELERLADDVLEPSFYNAVIVPDGEPNDDNRVPL